MARTSIHWAIARQWLAALTEDVRAPPTASSDALLAARKDIAIALMDGQVDGPSTFEHPFIYRAASVSLPPSRWAIYDAARPTGSPTPGQRVVRRTPALPFNAIQQDTFPKNSMSGRKATLTHGPFLDRMNREVYIDVFRPSPFRSFEFFINGIFVPHLYTTSPVESGGSFVADLGRGTVWIRADMFTRSGPVGKQATESTYFGLAIESGTLTLPPLTTGQRSLNLNLAGTATDSPIFSIAPITTVSFLFTVDENNIVSATITSLGDGATTVLGSKFNMRPSEFNASYDGLVGRINFAMTADNSTFAPAMQSSTLVDSSGTSTVVAAAWSIPLKDVDGITVYEVATAGGFSLSVSGGTVVDFRGDNQGVSLQECNVFVDSGSLIITGSRGQMPVRSRTVIIGEAAANATTPKSR
ncbi:hypothetical protein LTR66_005023 [Elasticomyces elasticus]|nr:hypothetical protein LTR28_007399 [Elasticomyces elasticus]KAK4995091.1 hypothetical protein LTR66_005023 [Elasticomyces elasticus]